MVRAKYRQRIRVFGGRHVGACLITCRLLGERNVCAASLQEIVFNYVIAGIAQAEYLQRKLSGGRNVCAASLQGIVFICVFGGGLLRYF